MYVCCVCLSVCMCVCAVCVRDVCRGAREATEATGQTSMHAIAHMQTLTIDHSPLTTIHHSHHLAFTPGDAIDHLLGGDSDGKGKAQGRCGE